MSLAITIEVPGDVVKLAISDYVSHNYGVNRDNMGGVAIIGEETAAPVSIVATIILHVAMQ